VGRFCSAIGARFWPKMVKTFVQAEQGNHNLGLQVLLSLEVDAPAT
jgi:hypothetical protein